MFMVRLTMHNPECIPKAMLRHLLIRITLQLSEAAGGMFKTSFAIIVRDVDIHKDLHKEPIVGHMSGVLFFTEGHPAQYIIHGKCRPLMQLRHSSHSSLDKEGGLR